jgi:uncharacterized protein YneF (UPF0154 family)
MFEASIITLKLFGSMALLFVVILGGFIMITRTNKEIENLIKELSQDDDK